MFAQLGKHKFEGLKTPTTFSETKAVTYGETPLVNAKNVLQATGKKLDSFSLTITYASELCDPDKEIMALEKSMNDCEVLPYILGDGTIKGNFVITDIQTNILRTSANGTTELATVTISLLEKAGEVSKVVIGEAVVSRSHLLPPVYAPDVTFAPVAPVTPSGSIIGGLTKAKSNVSLMRSVLNSIKKGTSSLRSGIRKVQKLAEETQQLYISAKTKLEATKKIAQRAAKLPTSLSDAWAYVDNLTKLDDVADITVLEKNIKQLEESTEKISRDAAPVAAYGATKEGGE